ncbi:MAG: CoA pyrophosphatase [Salaquimonas sp.]|nr:CoA pyrophosphatase [Salaquimonas sp.]
MRASYSTDPALLTGESLRSLAHERLIHGDDRRYGDFTLNPEVHADLVDNPSLRPAAVLMPVFERPEGLSVLLTKRHDQLKSHSGQVAFPGGKIDAEDESAEAAALREAHEEVGLDPALAEVLGRLPDYYTGSGYRIAPVLALVDAMASLEANPHEVDYFFEVPFAFLMDKANHRRGSRHFAGRERHFFEMPYGEHYIWGVTAGIIAALHDRMFS